MIVRNAVIATDLVISRSIVNEDSLLVASICSVVHHTEVVRAWTCLCQSHLLLLYTVAI